MFLCVMRDERVWLGVFWVCVCVCVDGEKKKKIGSLEEKDG